MIDFKYVGLYEVRIFPVSENGENGLGDEGADGAMPLPWDFWPRTAPVASNLATDGKSKQIGSSQQ